jgi:hypothetical protein
MSASPHPPAAAACPWKEKQMGCDEHPDLARKRGIDDLTDCSFYVPP